ncbi:hypothetical protein [Rubritalea profundi]|nr:hypothetical protein [Rubritalea profundi]
MKRRAKIFFQFCTPILALLGFISSFIKWGRPDHFHGQSFPFPIVMWDKAKKYNEHLPENDETFIDFVAPQSLLLNPLAFILTGLCLYLLFELLLATTKLVKHLRKK